MNPGSDHEPADAAEQMSAATQRLRDKGWMFSPLTSASVTTLLSGDDADRPAAAEA